jgi:hypothetical protein
MRIIRLIFTASLFSGCQKFTNVDEACKDTVPGEKHASHQTAVEAVARLNCYRRLAKVGVLSFDRTVQEVTEDHVSYMLSLDDLNGYTPGFEQNEQPGFTGVDLNSRLDAKNYNQVVGSLDRWELTPMRWPFNGRDNIDYLFPDPWVRQLFLQPLVIGAGFDEGFSDSEIDGGWMSYLTILYDSAMTVPPFVYPVDGQIDVDPTYTDEIMGGALVQYGEVGFPITLFLNTPVPVLEEYSLRGPNGDVDVVIHLPGDASWGATLAGTIAVTPLDPLEGGATYTFTSKVRADGQVLRLDSTFTTASLSSRPSFL